MVGPSDTRQAIRPLWRCRGPAGQPCDYLSNSPVRAGSDSEVLAVPRESSNVNPKPAFLRNRDGVRPIEPPGAGGFLLLPYLPWLAGPGFLLPAAAGAIAS